MNTDNQPQRVPEPKRRKQRRSALSRVVGWLFLIALAAVLAAGAASFYAYQEYSLPGPLAANKIVTIGPGMGAPDIAAQLKDEGVITDARIFSAIAFFKGTRTNLKPGEYEFAREASMRDVMTQIATGRSITYKLSVPEGWTTEMAAERIRANEVLTGTLERLPPEGAIMPDTYLFKRGMTRQELMDAMAAAQVKLLDELWLARSPALPLDSKEAVVTLASIVEKETAKAEERPVIASVFLNRLRKNMRLQSDPTIIYGIVGGKGKLGRSLTRTDIRTPTPYNTYTIKGLPPGPIANPGRAALEAVLNPQDTEYLYFVADGSGGHAFAATLEDHNKNVANWRKLAKGELTAAAEEAEGEATADGPEAEPEAPPPSDAGSEPASEAAAASPDAALPVPGPAGPAIDQPATPPDTQQAAAAPAAPPAPEPETPAVAEPPGSTTTPPPAPKAGAVVKVGGKLTVIPRRKPRT